MGNQRLVRLPSLSRIQQRRGTNDDLVPTLFRLLACSLQTRGAQNPKESTRDNRQFLAPRKHTSGPHSTATKQTAGAYVKIENERGSGGDMTPRASNVPQTPNVFRFVAPTASTSGERPGTIDMYVPTRNKNPSQTPHHPSPTHPNTLE